ncbi:MAG: hypothetical protein KHZ77_00330 [Veillonella sp.]|uniref:hypothetical protein n=1 Tax=Veillonella sp. TaxID=1926307 RepID=UPI0025D1A366|nr:hypothetical protein [Veillonella sp.]MBS4912598.1 hypothetical protein [Veillonella sp.]
MMIAPIDYIDEHKNDTLEELIAARSELEQEIAELEKELLGIGVEDRAWDDLSDEEKARLEKEWEEGLIIKDPGPEVEYQCKLMYLAALCDFIREKYNREVIWGGSRDYDEEDDEGEEINEGE